MKGRMGVAQVKGGTSLVEGSQKFGAAKESLRSWPWKWAKSVPFSIMFHCMCKNSVDSSIDFGSVGLVVH